jgi:spoIIIJ-associated protein
MMAQEEPKTIEQLNEEADIAADYLEGLLDIADYDGDIELGVRNNRATLQIVADDDTDIKHLIGRNGEVVDALQQLTRLAVQQKTGDRSHLILDVDGYLKRKRKHLQDIAFDAIDEARETGEPVDLKPMNSFERKVVHDLVRDEGLKSRSHGEEPHRYVSIFVKAGAQDALTDDDSVGVDESNDDISGGEIAEIQTNNSAAGRNDVVDDVLVNDDVDDDSEIDDDPVVSDEGEIGDGLDSDMEHAANDVE